MVSVPGVAPCVLATRTLDPSTTGSHGGLKRFGFRNFEEKLRVPCFPCIFLYVIYKLYIYILAWFAVIGYPCLMPNTSLDREVDALPPSLNELGPATQLRSVHSYRGKKPTDEASLRIGANVALRDLQFSQVGTCCKNWAPWAGLAHYATNR